MGMEFWIPLVVVVVALLAVSWLVDRKRPASRRRRVQRGIDSAALGQANANAAQKSNEGTHFM